MKTIFVSQERAALTLSFVLGFLFGALVFPTWQVAVESAQVIAGAVAYTPGNAFNEYHLRAWTILHQALAPWLALGLSEQLLSIILSGILTGLTFAALSLCTYALCHNSALSILSPIVILALFGTGDQYGVVYPVYLTGTEHTYGVAGRAIALLTWSLLALGYRRTGAVLLGIAPAIHATWGAWTIAVALVVILWEERPLREKARAYAPAFATGLLVTCVSFAYQWTRTRNLPDVDPAQQAAVWEAFLTEWDFHRRPLNFARPGVYLTITSVVLSLIGLTAFRNDNAPPGTQMLRALAITGIAGLLGCVAAGFPDLQPDLLNRVIPARFINLSALVLPAVLIGLAARHLARLEFKVLLALHLLYVFWNWFFLTVLSSDKYGWTLAHWKEFIVVSIFVTALRAASSRWPQNNRFNSVSTPLILATTITIAIAIPFLAHSNRNAPVQHPPDSVLHAAATGEGLIITAGNLSLIQLRTGRPILLNVGALDQIGRAPSSGPEMAHVLDRVYGIDLFAPPDDIRDRRPGALLPESARELWESRTPSQWRAVAQEFNAHQILTYGDWTLQLPEIARNDQFALFEIPKE